jgi:hypothetical protein
MISLINLPGRFGNIFFRNIGFHFICEKYGINVNYWEESKINRMGIELYNGTRHFNPNYPTIEISDSNFMDIITNEYNNYNFSIKFHTYFQTKEFVLKLYDYFHNTPVVKNKIIDANIFRDRMNNNDDVFIHVRLGDIPHANPGYDYYDKLLSAMNFANGYISSDTINSEICYRLINKYNLKVLEKDEIETIMYANTCKYLILSQGTFSWMMGLFAYNAEKIYYPKIKTQWHGDIFVFPGLTEVDY